MDMSVNLNLSYSAKSAQGSASSSVTAPSALATSGKSEVPYAKPPERAELEKAVKDIQDHVTSSQRNLEFSIDDTTHQVVVKVVATDTGEVVRQLPTEAALKLAQSLSDGNSLLFDTNI